MNIKWAELKKEEKRQFERITAVTRRSKIDIFVRFPATISRMKWKNENWKGNCLIYDTKGSTKSITHIRRQSGKKTFAALLLHYLHLHVTATTTIKRLLFHRDRLSAEWVSFIFRWHFTSWLIIISDFPQSNLVQIRRRKTDYDCFR